MATLSGDRFEPLRPLAAAMLVLQGCAVAPGGPSVMVLPGRAEDRTAQFQADQAGCQQQAQAQVAPSVDAANNQAAATAVVGTAIGAAIGALVGYTADMAATATMPTRRRPGAPVPG